MGTIRLVLLEFEQVEISVGQLEFEQVEISAGQLEFEQVEISVRTAGV